MNSEARQILEAVKAGSMSIDDALLEIKKEPFGSFLMLKITQNLLKMPDMCVGDAQKR